MLGHAKELCMCTALLRVLSFTIGCKVPDELHSYIALKRLLTFPLLPYNIFQKHHYRFRGEYHSCGCNTNKFFSITT